MMSEEKQENPMWYADRIVEMGPAEFKISLATRTVEKKDPPQLGPMDDQRLWFDIEVHLLLGGCRVGTPVRFPAHEALDPNKAFLAVFRQSLGIS